MQLKVWYKLKRSGQISRIVSSEEIINLYILAGESMKDTEFLNELSKEPHLRNRFEEILKLSSNDGNRFKTAEEAEEKAIQEVRKLGKEVLQSWGERREEALSKAHDNSSTFSKDEKKSCIGKVVLGKLQ